MIYNNFNTKRSHSLSKISYYNDDQHQHQLASTTTKSNHSLAASAQKYLAFKFKTWGHINIFFSNVGHDFAKMFGRNEKDDDSSPPVLTLYTNV